MNYNYVVTAHRPSKVSHSAVGRFQSADQRCLLVAKVTCVEVYAIAAEGLVLSVKLPIYGRVAGMLLFQRRDSPQEDLLILTEKHRLFVLRWDAAASAPQTTLVCDVKDALGSAVERAPIIVLDPNRRCVALQQYQHLLKFVPLNAKDPQAFNVRLTDEDVIDIVFLHGCAGHPTIAVLARDSDDRYHVKTFEVSISEQDMAAGPWGDKAVEVDAGATKLVPMPVPTGGVLVISEQGIAYVNGDESRPVACGMEPAVINAVGVVDANGARFLLGDHLGRLKMLVVGLDGEEMAVSSLQVFSLGETSIASSISYCDNSYVYVGSDMGDSQLIKLENNSETKQCTLDVVQTYEHLGPITDFCVVKGGGQLRHGQGQVVTCSGGGKDGSLRIIRNGIGISSQATVALPIIRRMWSLRKHYEDRYHSYLVASFTDESFVFELFDDSNLGLSEIPNIDKSVPSLFLGNMMGDIIVQVTSTCVNIAHVAEPAWTPPPGILVMEASGNASHLVLATTGSTLVYLEVDQGTNTLVERGHLKLDQDVSCIDCTSPGIVAVGFWASQGEGQQAALQLISTPDLKVVRTIELEDADMARSILMATLENHNYLLIGLGDGQLLTYKHSEDGNELTDKRRLNIGTQTAQLSLFRSRGGNHVFASCDRPAVIYAERGGGKLLVSNVNLEEVARVCEFDTPSYPENLAIATKEALQIGAVDEIQKLHIRTVRLNQQPRRIVHLESASVFCVLTETCRVDDLGDETLECSVRLICDSTYDTLSEYKLGTDEVSSSVTVAKFKGDGIDEDLEYIVVGTGIVLPNEPESHSGRLLFFTVPLRDSKNSGRSRELVLSGKHAIKGVGYAVAPFDDRVLVGVNSLILLFSISKVGDELKVTEDISYHGNVLVLRLATRGDFALAGDMMRSVTLLRKETISGKGLEQLSRDYDASWTMAMEFVSDDNFVVAEMNMNFLTLHRTSSAANDTERMKLERTGLFHVGALVNRILPGSLVMQAPDDEDSPALQTLLFGTADGMVGVVATLSQADFDFFKALQDVLAKAPGLGGIKHADWRQFVADSPARRVDACRYIDGDLVETFLELPPHEADDVARQVGLPADTLTRRCEAMQRLH